MLAMAAAAVVIKFRCSSLTSVVSWGLWTKSSSRTDACSASSFRLRIGRGAAAAEMSSGVPDDPLRDTQGGIATLGRARSRESICS